MKNKIFLKITALILTLALLLPLAACKDEEDEGFNPYPYPDLSVYMDLPEYKSFTIEKSVLDKLMKAEMMAFCSQRKLTDVLTSGTVQLFDRANISYHVLDEDGQTKSYYEGESWLIGGEVFWEFESGCIGMTVGQTKRISTSEGDYSVTLNGIERMKELTDEQCRQYSVYDTAEAFMAALKERCIFDYMWQSLMSKCVLKGYPTKEYTEYYSYFEGYFKDLAAENGMTLVQFLQVYGDNFKSYGLKKGMSEEEFRRVNENYAKSNLVNDLLTYSIMRAEKIKTEGAKWDKAVKVFENEKGKSYKEIVEESGETAAIISVLMIRISNILCGYVTITE